GITATIRGGVVTGTLGQMISQFESESLAPLPTPVNCPPSTQEVPLLQSFVTLTSLSTGDRLFYEYESGFTCVNAREGTFTFTGQGHWAGGTGQFAGANGPFEAQFNGIVHVADPNGNTFDSATGTVRGLLRVP
nr:hypothetical protein [Candidatus Tectomicrobia bacterium]